VEYWEAEGENSIEASNNNDELDLENIDLAQQSVKFSHDYRIFEKKFFGKTFEAKSSYVNKGD
jgi:hypothetical protein